VSCLRLSTCRVLRLPSGWQGHVCRGRKELHCRHRRRTLPAACSSRCVVLAAAPLLCVASFWLVRFRPPASCCVSLPAGAAAECPCWRALRQLCCLRRDCPCAAGAGVPSATPSAGSSVPMCQQYCNAGLPPGRCPGGGGSWHVARRQAMHPTDMCVLYVVACTCAPECDECEQCSAIERRRRGVWVGAQRDRDSLSAGLQSGWVRGSQAGSRRFRGVAGHCSTCSLTASNRLPAAWLPVRQRCTAAWQEL
jgi:hypothetical protein